MPKFANKIHPVYEVLQWKWMGKGIPSVTDIKEVLYGLINNINEHCISNSTGGLTAKIVKDDDCGDSLCIEMSIKESAY